MPLAGFDYFPPNSSPMNDLDRHFDRVPARIG
jgi:hypothetical protein